jgi:uncharacterized protein YdgA (DUF945 family)
MKVRVGVVLAIVAVLAGAGSVPAAQMMNEAATKQLDTAIAHAKNAAGASTLAQAELHLHHVINCIEGKDGKDYFAGSGDVCEGMGSGLLKDLQASGMAGGHALPYVEIAQSVSLWGLSQGMRKDLARAKAGAEIAQSALVQAKANFK